MNFQKIALILRENARLKSTLQRSFKRIKSELIQAGNGLDVHHEGTQIIEQSIQIQKDSNLDGDLNDPREKVVYRFFPDEQKFCRKSGQGYFQILQEPIYSVFLRLIPLIMRLKAVLLA